MQKGKKIAVYTCIYGGYDKLLAPLNVELLNQADFFCFSDKNIKSDIYKVITTNFDFFDPVKNSRYAKINPHLFFKEYDYSIYIDANHRIVTNDLEGLISKHLKDSNIARFRHDIRDCLYQEATMCIQNKLDEEAIILQQMERYRADGFPEHFGLGANCFIIRRHNEKDVVDHSKLWWNEVLNGSRRDQLSFEYVRWKLNTASTFIDERWYFSNIYYREGHVNEKSRHVKVNGTPSP
ncbi:MAG: DUF616 domain-containing protein [Saprospirales bacterium]|nr:DUF616 domain-containing protein [Saprospirales bacterium]